MTACRNRRLASIVPGTATSAPAGVPAVRLLPTEPPQPHPLQRPLQLQRTRPGEVC